MSLVNIQPHSISVTGMPVPCAVLFYEIVITITIQ